MAIKLDFEIPKKRDLLPSTEIAGRVSAYYMGPNDKMAREQDGLVFSRLDEETRDLLLNLVSEENILDGPEEDEHGFLIFTDLTELLDLTFHKIDTGFIAFAGSGPPIRFCDGEEFTDDTGAKAPCFCVNTLGCSTVKEIKDNRAACTLSLQILFSLDEAPGKVFQFRTGSDKVLGHFEAAREAFERGNKSGSIWLEQVRFKAKDGKDVSYSIAYPVAVESE